MLKSKPKVQKKLAKIVMASLLLSGVLPGMMSPSVAHAEVATYEIAGTVTKAGGQTVSFTTEDVYINYYYANAYGNVIYDSKIGVVDSPTVTADGYTMTVTKDTFETTRVVGALAYGGASNNTVTYSASDKSFDSSSYIGYMYAADVIGGQAVAGNADTNTVNIEAGMITTAVGGYVGGLTFRGSVNSTATTGDAINNTVNVNGGTVLRAVGGQVESGYILGASFGDEGSETTATGGNANSNHVNVNGGTVAVVAGGSTMSFGYYFYPYPGRSDGTANNNTVTITGGTLGITQTWESEDVDGNPITGSYKYGGMVYGGLSKTEASGNTVTVKGGNVDGAVIFGGLAYPQEERVSIADLDEAADSVNTASKADNNTVNILKEAANFSGLFGGVTGSKEDYSYKYGSGNTLNVAAKDVTAYTVGGFDNMNFYLPSNIANGDTMLTIKTPKTVEEILSSGYYYTFEMIVPVKYEIPEKGDLVDDDGNILYKAKPTDLTGVTFGVAAQQNVNLEVGNSVNLIVDENGLTTDDALKTADSATLAEAKFIADDPATYGVDDAYTFNIAKVDNNTIAATVTSKEKKVNVDERKSPAETREAVVSMVNMGADLIAGPGMQNAADAAAEENSSNGSATVSGAGGFAPFAAIGGSSLRAESGSHVDTKGIGLALGFARELKNSKGKLLIGPWVEYGHGKYDSYQDNGITADGKSHYWGVGVLAKQTNDNGLYYEGSLRVGRTGSDYSRNDGGGIADYDSKSTYWGAHLGIGKLVDIGHKNTLDYYGKYFYSHTGSDSVTIHTVTNDYRADFGSVNSHRLRVGARVTHELNEKNWIYGGLAYQYEFKGDARVTYNGDGSTPSPSVKGSSGLIELGWKVKPSKKSPMTIDVGVTGWVGKQRGITGNVQANWTF